MTPSSRGERKRTAEVLANKIQGYVQKVVYMKGAQAKEERNGIMNGRMPFLRPLIHRPLDDRL
jgi:hypothetical protein